MAGSYLRIIKTPAERLWSKVNKNTESGCWDWIGAKSSTGYGKLTIQGKSWRAHRLSYSLFNGGIDDGMFICHTCDNPSCVNPEHLFQGTPQDNVLDMISKNRHWNNGGVNHPSLTSYQSGCRCLDCKKIMSIYSANIRSKRRSSMGNDSYLEMMKVYSDKSRLKRKLNNNGNN